MDKRSKLSFTATATRSSFLLQAVSVHNTSSAVCRKNTLTFYDLRHPDKRESDLVMGI